MSFLAAGAVMLASFSGKLFTYRTFGTWVHGHLPYFVSFAAGVFAIVAWHLAEETLHEHSIETLAIGAGAGALIVLLSTWILSREHHHHEPHHGHSHSKIDGRRVLISDALHNTGDGIVLSLAFASSAVTGFGVAIAIFLHEAVQEISEFFVLKEAGYSNSQALTYNFLASSSILVGVFLGILLVDVGFLTAFIGAGAAGAIAFVIVADLIPHSVSCVRRHGKLHVHLGAVALGVLVMLTVQALIPHEEPGIDHVESVVAQAL